VNLLKEIARWAALGLLGLFAIVWWATGDDKSAKLTEAHDLAEQDDQAITDLTKRVDDLEDEVNGLKARRPSDSE
jgi:hypothetical protein